MPSYCPWISLKCNTIQKDRYQSLLLKFKEKFDELSKLYNVTVKPIWGEAHDYPKNVFLEVNNGKDSHGFEIGLVIPWDPRGHVYKQYSTDHMDGLEVYLPLQPILSCLFRERSRILSSEYKYMRTR